MLPMSQLVIPQSFDSCFTYEKQILWLKRKIEELEESGGGSSELDEIKARLDKVEQDLSNDEGDISTLQTSVSGLDTRLGKVEGDLASDEEKITEAQNNINDIYEYLSYVEYYAMTFKFVRNFTYGFKSRVGIKSADWGSNPSVWGMYGIDVRTALDTPIALPWNVTDIDTKYTMTGKMTIRGRARIEYTQSENVAYFDCVDIPVEDVVGNYINVKFKNDNTLSLFVKVYGVKDGNKTLLGENNDTFTISNRTDTYNGVPYDLFRFTNTGTRIDLDHQGDTYDTFFVEFTATLPFIAYKDTNFNANGFVWQPNNN